MISVWWLKDRCNFCVREQTSCHIDHQWVPLNTQVPNLPLSDRDGIFKRPLPITCNGARSSIDQGAWEICFDIAFPCQALGLLTPLSDLCSVMYCGNKQHCQVTLWRQSCISFKVFASAFCLDLMFTWSYVHAMHVCTCYVYMYICSACRLVVPGF